MVYQDNLATSLKRCGDPTEPKYLHTTRKKEVPFQMENVPKKEEAKINLNWVYLGEEKEQNPETNQ